MQSVSETSVETIVPTVPIPILLLEEEPDPLPRWMVYYAQVSYVLYGIHIVYSWFHLIFVRYILELQVFHIQFQPVYDFLEYNSYSILCPMLCTLFVAILIYHVRKKVSLDDGDFFGLLGVLVLLFLVMIYDATGVYHLYAERSQYSRNKSNIDIKEDPLDSNELSWQYAWSTKPTCARIHARRILEGKEKQRKEDEKTNPVAGPAQVIPFDLPGEINAWMYVGLNKSDLENGFLSGIVSTTTVTPPVDSDKTADEMAYENPKECNKSSDSVTPIDQPRDWMIRMQREMECCGPFGREEWQKKVNNLESCKQFTKGCAQSFNGYLLTFFHNAVIIMYLECLFYVISIILACIHYAAMKYEKTRIAKEYSLLNINEEGITVIDVEEDETEKDNRRLSLSAKGLDPVQNLFNKINIRGHPGRRNTLGEMHFPAALTLTISKLLSTKDLAPPPPRRALSSHHEAPSRSHLKAHTHQ